MYTYRCCRCRPAVQEIQKDRDLHEGLAIQYYRAHQVRPEVLDLQVDRVDQDCRHDHLAPVHQAALQHSTSTV